MTNKNELNELELNKISGGTNEYEEYQKEYTIKLDRYDTVNYINQILFFDANVGVDNSFNHYAWILGTLLNSYEKSATCGTKRTGTVKVIESNKYSSGETVDINLNVWRVFSK